MIYFFLISTYYLPYFFFFFSSRRRHTRLVSDWSSDVCSSDLGVATFQTVYPGWYQGRSVHIHVKVHVGGNVVHTGQLYFPDALTDKVYRRAPYNARPGRSTRNANDFVFANGGKSSMLSVHADGAGGYIGAITVGVVRS